ncbi:ABC transporter permease [Xylanibacter muris]|uniref:ABC transporter permease n=1 Tax=Xylanibacter muris TaxID=2736290 RepID=A0ABX2AJG2_9BACT|nr:FtsX-like permease family protein [Xylanibacter muris]NPD91251.1 ABC transporter permease [Xylanibacter muris]
MNFPLFIARRIYSNKSDKRKVSRPAIHIATIGVATGLAVMIITVSVVLGFKHSIRDKVIGFGSHIQVMNFLTMQSSDPYPICIDDSMINVLRHIEGVKHVQRYALTQGILKTDSDFLGISFKGISREYDTAFIKSNLNYGSIPVFDGKSGKYDILISQQTADKLRLKAGDKVFAYFFADNNVSTRRFKVAGIFQTNMSQFDNSMCFIDYQTAVKLNRWLPEQCTGAELTVTDFNRLESINEEVIENVNRTSDKYGDTFTSQTIHESYPQIFSWLELLDINVWVILILMMCVAGFTMISGLLIIILERTGMIGTLKALGAKDKTIRHTFLWFAVFIIGKGLLWGNIAGIGLILIQKYTGMVSLDPATYYVNTAPVEINIPLFALINISTLLISVFVLIAPSYLISHIHPAKSMRYE